MMERVGFSSKMNELEAAIGLGNLDNYHVILQKRRSNLYYLMDKFSKFSQVLKTFRKETDEEIGPHAYPIIVQEDVGFSRNELVAYMEAKGIDTRNLFSSIPTQCPGYAYLKYKLGDFPNAEYIGENGIHIGVHQDMGKAECDYVIQTVEEFLAKKCRQ
jgi:dTDP-4-amino-4,6-dideoxygalactose transaminase